MSRWSALLLVALAGVLVVGQSPALGLGVTHDAVVSATPNMKMPKVLDGRISDIEQVGNRIVVTGTFTQVTTPGGATLNRTSVFAFDPSTGAVDTAFAPAVVGRVNTAAAGPDGTVYLGGGFSSVNGDTRIKKVTQLSLATGTRTSFKAPGINGAVNDLALVGNRLFLGGFFTAVKAVPHKGLATLAAGSGALDEYMGVDVAVNHNWTSGSTGVKGAVGVARFDVSPDGTRLVAIGNFKEADGQVRDQVVTVLLDAGGARVDPDWRTRGYEHPCRWQKWDSYVRDVEFDPSGAYFVIVTTGWHYSGSLCDSAARWDVADRGLDVQPRWVDYTGGDTLLSVAVTDAAVYVGGHQRWLNNPLSGGDKAAAGAVPRPGLAALDPRNGLPLSWNPGRQPRGYGAEALLVTPMGLYVGHDTDYIGNRRYNVGKLAHFPLAGGTPEVTPSTRSLPANVFMAGRATATATAGVNAVVKRYYTGTSIGSDATVDGGGVEWGKARGAFMIGNELFYGHPDTDGVYKLVRRTFDGTTYGPATVITEPYLDPEWSTVDTGSGETYAGVLPNLYGAQLAGVTGMFYSNSRIYYTRPNSGILNSRYFSVESGIVGAAVVTAGTNASFASAAGMFVSGDSLYFATTNGDLRRTSWTNGVPGTTSEVVSGPSTGDGRNWASRTLFLGPGSDSTGSVGSPAPNTAPTASFTSTCTEMTCSFDASGSADADGDPLAYSWNFGDGTPAGTGKTTTHDYIVAGTYDVSLTVTDGRGGTGTSTQQVQAVAPAPTASSIALRGSSGTSSETSVGSFAVDVPAVEADDGLVLVLTTNSSVTGSAPAGFTEVGRYVHKSSTTTFMTSQVFQKVATGAEDGTSVSVPLSGWAKGTLQLVAYAGTSTAGPVRSVAGAGAGSGTSHTTPAATAEDGDWVLSVWSDKNTVPRGWTAPTGLAVRDDRPVTGSNAATIASLVADGGGPVAAGPVGGHTATVSASSNRAITLTVVLAPAV